MPITEPLIKGQDNIKNLLDVACRDDLPTLLVGETGTGKTSLVREVAQKNKRKYTRFSITGETTVDDFVGKYILRDGETKWQDGILLTAIKQGHYLVVDEINAALPEILFVLHSLLDDDKYVIIPQKDNTTVKPHKDFRFFATMNPVDEYAGTKELNKAFMSRFAMVLIVDYPSRETENQILQERAGVSEIDALKMVDVALRVRDAKKQDKIFYTFSTRDLIYWGKLVKSLGMHQAFRVAIRNKGMEDSQGIEAIYSQVFSDYAREQAERGTTNLEELRKGVAVSKQERANIKRQATIEAKKKLSKELDDLEEAQEALAKHLNGSTGIDARLLETAIKQGLFRKGELSVITQDIPF